MVAPLVNYVAEEILPRSFPHRRIRIHHHSNLSLWADWIYGMLQGSRSGYQRAGQELERGGGGEAVQILQQGDPPSEFCSTKLCQEGTTVMTIWP